MTLCLLDLDQVKGDFTPLRVPRQRSVVFRFMRNKEKHDQSGS